MPSIESLRKFEGFMLFAAVSFLLFLANTRNFCPGSPGLLAQISVFSRFIDLDIATPEQICLIEDFWVVYVPCALLGCFYFRAPIQKEILEKKLLRGKSPDLSKARLVCLGVAILGAALVLLMFTLPPLRSRSPAFGPFDVRFETKRLYGLASIICADAMSFGYALATWRQLPGLASPTNGEDGR